MDSTVNRSEEPCQLILYTLAAVRQFLNKNVKPTVLLIATSRWVPTARLAMALSRAGFAVEALCPSHHPIEKTGVVRETLPYCGLMGLTSIKSAICAAKPDIIIPCDDTATRQLHLLHDREKEEKEGFHISSIIERSLGSSESFSVVYERARFMELALQEGVLVPRTEAVHTPEGLAECMARLGIPLVLKANGTTGGEGVRVAHDREEAERAFQALHRPPLLARAAKRALIDQDSTLVWPAVLRRQSLVNAQAFVQGREGTSVIACWKGTVLAALHFEVVEKRSFTGPATVLRLIESADMATATDKMARRLNLSGIHGFDFMLENGSGDAYLIEINPRTTQVGHLTLGPKRDIPAALYAVLSGNPVQPAQKLTERDTFALFPHEWMRDPDSEYLGSAYHDVPWESPALVSACLRTAQAQLGWQGYRKFLPGASRGCSPRIVPIQANAATVNVSSRSSAEGD